MSRFGRIHPGLFFLLMASASGAFAGDCELVSSTCIDTSPTKRISGVDIPVSVVDGCWEYEDTYGCLSSGLTEDPYCQELRDRGCSQTGSTCIDESDNGCLTYEQTYECPADAPPAEQAVLDCGGQLFCLDGNCFDTGYEPNSNMGRVGALLSVMDALSDELGSDRTEVFKGDDMRCGVSLFDKIGAHNCCKVSGWAEGVFNCSFEEEQLADLRKARRCHYVGSYCSNETVLGVCLVRKQTYCCFGSKLSRIIAEQGSPQLGKGWGSAKSPDCSGFTLDEVSQLDFEAMDLSEFYADVIASMPTVDANEMQQRMTDRMDQLLP